MRSPHILLLTLFAALAAAQTTLPTISAVENNFSYTSPGLPNYGIAQGSIFVIFGTNLASTPSGLQGVPLQTTLDGVSVQITVGGTSTQALLYYVMPDQVAGVLPSATPFGTGQITLTSNGQTSAPAPITVVQSVFGIDTGSGSFGHAAMAFDAKGNALSASNAANPGDTIVLYGTGAGPVPGNEALPPTTQNLTNIPMEVDIGSVAATIAYHGRSGFPGLDQINLVVPAGVAGCNVSVAAISSGLVSNVAFIPVAGQGRTCSDAVPGVVPPAEITISGKSVVNTAQIQISRSVHVAPAVTVGSNTLQAVNQTLDNANAFIQRVSFSQPVNVGLGNAGATFPSLGNCTVSSLVLPLPGSSTSTNPSTPPANAPTMLNAGPAINFTDSNGTGSALLQSSGFYAGKLGGVSETLAGPQNTPLFLPAAGGPISIDNGSGGPDLGPFTTQITAASPIVWTNMSTLPSTIDRSQGVTLTWTGGNPTGVAGITASSSVLATGGILNVDVSCQAPVSAGQFTIPAWALLSLPPGLVVQTGNILQLSSLELGTGDQSPAFSAQGLDAGIVTVGVQSNLTVAFQ